MDHELNQCLSSILQFVAQLNDERHTSEWLIQRAELYLELLWVLTGKHLIGTVSNISAKLYVAFCARM